MDSWLTWLGDKLEAFLVVLISWLPDSPFADMAVPAYIYDSLAYANYFVPVSQMISILQAWLVCVGLYYAISVALRWFKAVE